MGWDEYCQALYVRDTDKVHHWPFVASTIDGGVVMMKLQPLNDHCFTQPHWRVLAQGFDTERWFHDGQASGTGGIKNPSRGTLKLHHRYYRLTSSMSTMMAQLGGGWWLSFDDFNTIRHYAERNGLEFPYAARLFLALPYEWSRLDRIVSAVLAQPVDAYAGEGKVARTTADQWTPLQHLRVTQLYIPGLVSHSGTNHLYEQIWESVQTQYAHNHKMT